MYRGLNVYGYIIVHTSSYNALLRTEPNTAGYNITGRGMHKSPDTSRDNSPAIGKGSGIDIQTSTRDWNHPVFCAGSLLPEVAISSNLSHRRIVLLL